jgi:5-(aminomethyl)-3-furanmethanol phosphate kinase
MSRFTVVKVGGSLYDWPELAVRLRSWLAAQRCARLLLVPGGGAMADVIRDLDARHALGESAAHWLALMSLTLNAHFLGQILHAPIVADPALVTPERITLLDAHAFALADEERPGCLPHCWKVTSDSVAARVAVVGGADELVLLKSATFPADLDWPDAARRGLVDEWFTRVLRQAPGLSVRAVNLRGE